jgi:hypothetical protein
MVYSLIDFHVEKSGRCFGGEMSKMNTTYAFAFMSSQAITEAGCVLSVGFFDDVEVA